MTNQTFRLKLKRILGIAKRFFTSPKSRFCFLTRIGLHDRMEDEKFLRKLFKLEMGKDLDLDNPQTFNEKLQWIKLYDRKPQYTMMADKYRVRDYVAEKIGEEHLVPLLGVWDRAEDIDFDILPDQFVLKCNHDSGSVIICKDKKTFDSKEAVKKLRRRLNRDAYLPYREWPYKDISRKVIAEKFLVDESGYELKDFKFYCFDGQPKIMYIRSDTQMKGGEDKHDFYDMDFNHLSSIIGLPNSKKVFDKPQSFEEMKRLAMLLSKGIPHVRVDFYDINGRIYFGELTFFSEGGMGHFQPEEWDYKLGSYIKLPGKDNP